MAEVKDDIRDWVIYKITSPSGRIYIGKSVNIKKRLSSYKTLNCASQPILFGSFKKYGYENHKIEIIDSFLGGNTYASGKEIFWIRSFMSQYHKYPKERGMNLTIGGDGATGLKMSSESKEKMSLMKKGKPPPNKGKKGQKAWNKGIKGIQVAWNKGKDYSYLSYDERRTKFGSHNIGRTHNRGRVHTKEFCEQMRIAKTGKSLEKRCRPIVQYNSRNEIIGNFKSWGEAHEITGISLSTIHSLIKSGIPGKRKKCYFKYTK